MNLKNISYALAQDFCLLGLKSRRKYFANLALKYVIEAEEIINLVGEEKRKLSVFEESIIKSNYNLAEKCLGSAEKFLEKNLLTKINYECRLEQIAQFLKDN